MKIKYRNLYVHFVFTTSRRESMIPEKNRLRIQKYIKGIVRNNASRLYAIYANPDHLHLLISMNATQSVDELATIIADSSTRFINTILLECGTFKWQQSAAAFSVSKDNIDRTIGYINNQAEHHKNSSSEVEHPIRLYRS